MAKGPPTLARVSVGTSGWSYPVLAARLLPGRHRPGGVPRLLRRALPDGRAEHDRLPAARPRISSARWAEQVPDGFEFAPKLPGNRLRGLDEFGERVRALGDRLGPVRVSLKNARDEGVLELLLGSLDPALRLAFDLEHPSWDGIEERLAAAGAVRVNDLDHPAPFRYLRRREPPDDEFAATDPRAAGAGVRLLPPRRGADRAGVRSAAARELLSEA